MQLLKTQKRCNAMKLLLPQIWPIHWHRQMSLCWLDFQMPNSWVYHPKTLLQFRPFIGKKMGKMGNSANLFRFAVKCEFSFFYLIYLALCTKLSVSLCHFIDSHRVVQNVCYSFLISYPTVRSVRYSFGWVFSSRFLKIYRDNVAQ